MLHEFLSANSDELVKRCADRVGKRLSPAPAPSGHEFGIPILLQQLVYTLRQKGDDAHLTSPELPPEIGGSAEKHGAELFRLGFTLDQVVREYGDLCQVVSELADERGAPITNAEFHTLNLCLDVAISEAVTEFERQHDTDVATDDAQSIDQRLAVFATDLQILVNSASLSFEAIRAGAVAPKGATGTVLGRSLIGLRLLVDRTLAEVRLRDGAPAQRKPFALRGLIDDVLISVSVEARERGVSLTASPVDSALIVDADRHMLSSAIGNLLRNAFKFTRPRTAVSLSARVVDTRLLIDVADECGGLAPGNGGEIFGSIQKRSGNRSGLGLSLSRRAVEANGGKLLVRSLEGKGCVFSIDLPLPATH